MRRLALFLSAILALGLGACSRVPPADRQTATSGVATPLGVSQPLDFSQELAALAQEPLPEFSQFIDAGRAAAALQQAIASTPAVEVFGQQFVDDLNAAIDDLQAESPGYSYRDSTRLAMPARLAPPGQSVCAIDVRVPYEKDGFSGEITVKACAETKGDRVLVDFSGSAQLQGSAPDRLGQVFDVSYSTKGDQSACPNAEGKSTGTFSGRWQGYVKGSETAWSKTRTGTLHMEAYNAEDGHMDRGEFGFEGSADFEANGDAMHVPYTSEAKGVKPNDIGSIYRLLAENTKIGDVTTRTGLSPVTVKEVVDAIHDSMTDTLGPLLIGNDRAEENWQYDNRCVRIKNLPDELRLAPGESATVEAEIVLNDDGASVAADLEAEVSGKGGRITPEKSSSSPGAPAAFTYTAPQDKPEGYFSLAATSKAGKAYRTVFIHPSPIEWSGTFTMEGSSSIPDLGSSQVTSTFTIRFQADLNRPSTQVGDPGGRGLIPFELEEGADLAWSGTATALGISQSFSGSTSNLITPDYANPEWPFSLPAGDYLAGEGYVDLNERKLYLFLIGMGNNIGVGTFNLAPTTSCSYYHDLAANRVYLVFPLDEEYKIADSSCWDQATGDLAIQSTRSWHFETRYLSGSESGP